MNLIEEALAKAYKMRDDMLAQQRERDQVARAMQQMWQGVAKQQAEVKRVDTEKRTAVQTGEKRRRGYYGTLASGPTGVLGTPNLSRRSLIGM